MGNEESVSITDNGLKILTSMKAGRAETRHLAADLDRAAASGRLHGKGGLAVCDVMGYNYADPQAEAWHKNNPKIAILGTENVSAVGTRGHYITDPARGPSAPTIRTPPPAAHRPKAGGASSARGPTFRAVSCGPASITAASRRPTSGRTSVRNTASSTPADFPRTPSSTTSPGGPRSRCCTCSRTGTGRGSKGRRSRFGCIRIWTGWSCSTTARAWAPRTCRRTSTWPGT